MGSNCQAKLWAHSAPAAATSARPPIAPAAGSNNLSSQPFSPAALTSLNFFETHEDI
jgi:hypothetical protein